MPVYKRSDSDVYSYDFRMDGIRYHGSTGCTDMADALEFETAIRSHNKPASRFCRNIIRKARRNLPKRPRAKSGYVYMVRSGYMIKIGYAVKPEERLKTIMTSVPGDCDLLFCLPGDTTFERRLHQEFAVCHHVREWFFLCGPLKRFVEEFEQEKATNADVRQTVPLDLPSSSELKQLRA